MLALEHRLHDVVDLNGKLLLERPAVAELDAGPDEPEAHAMPGHALGGVVHSELRVVVFRVGRSVGEAIGGILNGIDDFARGRRAFARVIDDLVGENRPLVFGADDKSRLLQRGGRHPFLMTIDGISVDPALAAA